MASSINTNVASMNAQRNLSRSQGDLNTAIQRLSSGLRINSAKDDAAGSAIANRMTTQIGGLTVAIRNANDGISVAQTAEGAMEEMANNMNRARDLAVQAASYNNSTDRATINKEVSQILDEMSRIVNQTRYNGEKVLTGSFSGDFQVGAQVNETINVAVGNLSPSSLGVASEYSTVSGLSSANLASRVAFSYNNAIATANTIEGTNFTTARASGTTTSTKVADINSLTSSTGVSAFSFGNGLVGTNYATAGTSAGVTDGIAAGSLSINGVAIGAVASAASDGAVATNLVAAINSAMTAAGTGITASIVAAADGTATNSSIVLTNTSGAAISITTNSSNDAGVTSFFAAGTTSVAAGENGAIVLNDDLNDLTTSYNSTVTGAALTGVASASTTLTNATLNSQSVTTAASANLAMLVFERSLDTINSERGTLGAKLNRLEGVTRNLSNVVENISAARGRIQDTDFASETAKLTRAQILQQAGTAMVAQANQLPQGVLSLLGR